MKNYTTRIVQKYTQKTIPHCQNSSKIHSEKLYHTIRIVQKYTQKNYTTPLEQLKNTLRKTIPHCQNSSKIHSEKDRDETDINNKHIHVHSLSWLGTGTLINKKKQQGYATPLNKMMRPLSKTMQSCKFFPHVSKMRTTKYDCFFLVFFREYLVLILIFIL